MLTQHNDNFRTGVNLQETVLSPANVNKAHFGMLFKREVDDQLYTQPLVVTGVTVGGGKRDLVYVTTVNNSVYSFDANDAAASAPVWHVNFGTPANVNSTNFGCLDINGHHPQSARRRQTLSRYVMVRVERRRLISSCTVWPERGIVNLTGVRSFRTRCAFLDTNTARLKIAIADPIAAVPAHCPENDVTFKMTPLEL
jgi:hypothetical protein